MQEVSETLETDTSIEHLYELLGGLHLSSEPSAPATPSPVLEFHHLVANSSGPFNSLKPLRPATFIFEFSPTFDFGPTQKTDSQMSGQAVSMETPEIEEPRETPSPSELHHLVANSSGPFNSLKPLRPATFFFEFSPTFGFGQKQNCDSQMSGQEGSMERPETADPTATPSPSEGQGAALKTEDHVGDGSSTSWRASKAAKKVKRMRKTKNRVAWEESW
ncbi:hypothetical protein IRJ41_002635 [Triplophysa rosa]|uniref:Uncharacterized protein n=1 Tax=Triplophysa rosa TaxID=992332 RepID=A0A9W7WZE2_TRIRA|nr:hypothetical protein IRJ41_002635 [Triplophysa rosa]